MNSLTTNERRVAALLMERNKNKLARISSDCDAPIVAVRRALKSTAQLFGQGALKNERPISAESWRRITVAIAEQIFDGEA